ncbi:MAG: UDP-N-acetylmuramoyl-L-alanyl-D-glutamate--2,6-diaminopimelate ligase [Lachnospiraceae bacterium]
MTLRDLLNGISYMVIKGNVDFSVTDIAYDSRSVKEGSLFVCVKGTTEDGQEYIEQALEKGASGIVVEHKIHMERYSAKSLIRNTNIILVADCSRALAYLSANYFEHPAKKCIMIGITGTKGKTTTSYMIKRILEEEGNKVGLIGTNGAYIMQERIGLEHTTPPSYEVQRLIDKMVKAGCHYVIMEVSSIGLKMGRVAGIHFNYAIFTNLSPDHIGGKEHKDFEEYIYWKSTLFSNCNVAIVNEDDKYVRKMLEEKSCQVITYGMEKMATYMATNLNFVKSEEFLGSSCCIINNRVRVGYHPSSSEVHEFSLVLGVPGRFNIYNGLAALSCCMEIGCFVENITKALYQVHVKGRVEVVYSNPKFHVMIDYAHNAASLESLLVTLKEYNPTRLVCIFGCGGNRSVLRRYSMGEISGTYADLSIITEDNSRQEEPMAIIEDIIQGMKKTDGDYMVIPDRKEAIGYSITNAQKGDFIVLVGKGHEDYQETDGIKRPFSEHNIIKEILSKKEEEYLC